MSMNINCLLFDKADIHETKPLRNLFLEGILYQTPEDATVDILAVEGEELDRYLAWVNKNRVRDANKFTKVSKALHKILDDVKPYQKWVWCMT